MELVIVKAFGGDEMRNKYPGVCYKCGKRVEVGEGHFERHQGKWRVQHKEEAMKGEKE